MNPRVCISLAAFWMLGATPIELSAQRELHFSRRYTMNDGLPESAVTCVLQDSRGFIWLATYDGLSRFDGYKFTTYTHDPASETSLGHNRVNKLWEDGKGRLWVAHMGGLDLFDPKTEQFRSLRPDTLRFDLGVGTFRERRDGKLWICGFGGVYIADTEALSFERLTNLPDDGYADIVETRDGSLWAAGQHSVVHIDGKTGEASIYKPDPTNRFGSGSFAIYIDEQERVWIGSNGLYLFNPQSKSFTGFLTTNHVRQVQGHFDGKLLVGHGHGLFLFDPRTGAYDTVAKGWSTSILKDRQGTLWHSTLIGLNQINSGGGEFRSEKSYGNVWSIEKDGNLEIWMIASKGAFRFDSSFSEVLEVRRGGGGPLGFMGADREGSIYFTISPNKFRKYDFRSKTIAFEQVMPVADEFVISLFVDSFGHAWLGRWNGVTRYNPHTKSVEQVVGFPKSAVYCFLEDADKKLWIGSDKGLIRYDLVTGELLVLKNDPADEKSLSDNTVFHLAVDTAQNLWVGTGRGINKLIKGTEHGKPEFMSWTMATSDLPNDNVYCIVDGVDGTLWLACGNIVSHFDPAKNYFRNYERSSDRGDGLVGAPFRNAQYLGGKGIRSSDGKIIFCVNAGGLLVFHPDSLVDNSFVPPIVITDFLINNQRVPIAKTQADTLEWKTPLQEDVSYTAEMRLAYSQNDFSFEFAALNFVNPEDNRYKYKLEPYETAWIETPASNRMARYTNIDPGTYTFRVIGSNNDGVWNEEGASLLIIIAPPWWRTWWAYSLYAVAVMAIFLYWRSYENKRIKLKHRAEHLSELDSLKTRFFTNISHEFRTPITLILGPLKELYHGTFKGDPKPAFATMMRNGQRLLRLINQLLDLSKLEAGKMHLHAVPTELVQFIREIAASYESLAKEKGIKYFFYSELSQVTAYVDPEKIEKVVHNLLSNAFKFTKEGGEIILYLKAEGQGVALAVKDTGVGIPRDQVEKIFDRFFQVDSSHTRQHEGSGLGMAIAKELAELHHGKLDVGSVDGRGTTFTLWLPLGGQQLKEDEISGTREPDSRASLNQETIIPGEDLTSDEQVDKIPITLEDHPVILIVEDNSDMRQYIRRTLTEFYHLAEAANGKEGVERAQEIIPDLIISDVMMPEMDGYKLCEIIKTNELTSHVPVILLTAKTDRESKLAGLETGADDYLSKPFDPDELKLIVRNRIEERRKLRERFAKEITLEPRQISVTSLDEKFLTKVLSIIETRLEDENFSIDELSREAGFSNMHFYRKIKALAGETPSQFLRTIRLKRAAELLSGNSDNVTQIAYSVGFSSLSYFNKCFKEQFGVTPGQYREQVASGSGR